MRIWSLHPRYLDAKGIVALWREALLAKHVLEGKTKGYKNHPQLHRFKRSPAPLDAINAYLAIVYQEAVQRQYKFDARKIDRKPGPVSLQVTTGQLKYETGHLLKKLSVRDPPKYLELKSLPIFEPHPLFDLVEGEIEVWEVVEGKIK